MPHSFRLADEEVAKKLHSLLKALASSKRIMIIGLLSEEDYPRSSLDDYIMTSEATLHEHLDKLIAANLIEPYTGSDGKRYYRLTELGRKIHKLLREIYIAISTKPEKTH